MFSLMLLLLVASLHASPSGHAQTAANPKLEEAIAVLRRVRPAEMTEAQGEAKTKQIEAAWATLRAAGANGVARLKEEVRRVEAAGETDDYFKLNAGALLWEIGKLEEVPSIASIWRTTPLEAQYNYVFYTAVEAAATGDARALPLLEATLKDAKGKVYFYQHAMEVEWPLTHEFIWGAFGAKGLPRLHAILESSSAGTIELQSAVLLLGQAHYLPALERIRALAGNAPDADVRFACIRALGVYGHPQDFDFLVAGLRSSDPKAVLQFAYALYEYEDLRAVQHLIPLLEAPDAAVRREAFASLSHLLNSDALDAMESYSRRARTPAEKEFASDHINEELREYNLTLNAYLGQPPAERARTIKRVRDQREAGRHALRQGERGYTHAQLLAAAATWRQQHRLQNKETDFGKVEARHILSGASATDIPLLLDVRAALYLRFSDEAMYEVRRLDAVVRRLGRSRYRKEVGIAERVEAL